jgi:hypothetical protein
LAWLRTIVFLAGAYDAQQPPAEVPLHIPNPHYVTMSESAFVAAAHRNEHLGVLRQFSRKLLWFKAIPMMV